MKFDFIHKVAVAAIAICALFASSCEYVVEEFEVTVSDETVSYEKGNVFIDIKCSGAWTLYLVSPDGGDVDWASLETGKEAGTGDASLIVLYYDKNKGTVDRALKIVLDNGTDWAECLFTQECEKIAQDPEDPDRPDDPDTPEPGLEPDLSKTGWMELPAMDDPDLEYYSHSFDLDGKTYRNYSFGYSKEHYLAIWVAYPLSSFYTSGSASGGGSDWDPNPLIDEDYQPNYYKSFGYSQGYERGHQIANADRRCSKKANLQTYYYTNATLQRKDFNGHIWAALEGNLRSVANNADTLYVVTGCVVDSDPDYIKDYYGHQVSIPSGYFKAALRYSNSSSLQKWMGAAFYLNHEPYSYSQITASEVMSIDALEEKLGMDIFVNLETMIGKEEAAKVESQSPLSYKTTWYIQ